MAGGPGEQSRHGRRKAPLGLKELEELYRLAPVGLCAVDRDLRFVRANDAYAAIVGCEVDELTGRLLPEVIPASLRDEAVGVTRKVIETGEPILETELRRVVPDDPSMERVWLVNVHPMRTDGQVTGAMAVLQNVTSLRRAEEAARERLRELESLYRNAPVGLCFVSSDLRYLRVNQVIAEMNGTTIEAIVGKRYRDLSPDTADLAEPFLRKLMESGETVRNMEVRSRPPSDPDREHVYLLSLEPVRDGAGEAVGHVSAVQDVTDQRAAEEIAARRLAELEILYANAPVGLCHMDTDLRIVQLNPLFARLSERPLEEQVGADAADVLPPQIARQLVPHLRYAAQAGESSRDLEIRGEIPGSHGEYTWLAHTHPLRSRTGAPTGLITVLQDVTSLVERRREVEAVRDRLAEAQRVARVGSWEWDILEDEVWWSQELYEIFGERRDYLPSYVGFFEHVHAEDRQKVRGQIEQTLVDGRSYRVTFRIVQRDGTQRVLFTAARLERTPGGQPARLVGTCQDVTEAGPLSEE